LVSNEKYLEKGTSSYALRGGHTVMTQNERACCDHCSRRDKSGAL